MVQGRGNDGAPPTTVKQATKRNEKRAFEFSRARENRHSRCVCRLPHCCRGRDNNYKVNGGAVLLLGVEL